MSTGEEDHVRNVIEQLGNLHFWLLAIKPGKPVALGQIGTVPLIGLPGNPALAFVTFVTIAKTADPKTGRRSIDATEAIPGTCWFRPPQEAGTPRVSARQIRTRRERPGCDEISA